MAFINGKKVLQVVQSVGGTSSTLLITTTDATLVSGTTYELALTYLTETPAVDDFIAYVDSGAITTLYQVTAVDSTNATLTKIGDIGGGGSQLYQHNVCLVYDNSGISRTYITITNSNPNKMFNTLQDFVDYLKTNYSVTGNPNGASKLLKASGFAPNVTVANTVWVRCVYALYHNTSLNNSIYCIGFVDGTNYPAKYQVVNQGGTIDILEDVETL